MTKLLSDAIAEEQNGDIGVFYKNKNKAAGLLQRAGQQLLGTLFRTDGFIHSIRETGSPVNMKFSDITETLQFKRWFGDWVKNSRLASKIVDANGKPMVVYHRTNEFTMRIRYFFTF